jgi:hypothetical protein
VSALERIHFNKWDYKVITNKRREKMRDPKTGMEFDDQTKNDPITGKDDFKHINTRKYI